MRYINEDGSLDRQQMFNDVWAGFVRQNWSLSYKLRGRAVDEFCEDVGYYRTPTFEHECAYRGEVVDGIQTCCGIGHLIPNELYDPEMEGKAVHYLKYRGALLGGIDKIFLAIFGEFPDLIDDDEDFLISIQEIHDEVVTEFLLDKDDEPFSVRLELGRDSLQRRMIGFAHRYGLNLPKEN